jgi:FlaA1/EpsC-like NDP-sugar epimerase
MSDRGPSNPSTPVRALFARVWVGLVPHRFAINAAGDLLVWIVALVSATLLRFDFALDQVTWTGLLLVLPLAVVCQFVFGLADGLYLGRWSFGSFEEVASLLRTVLATGTVVFITNLLAGGAARPVPTSVPIIGTFLALVSMAGLRYAWRLVLERRLRPSADRSRLIVFGAGEAGEQIVTALLRNPESPYLPVALIDDDPRKGQLRMRGVPVRGGREQLLDVAKLEGADAVLVAIPSASANLVREISAICLSGGLQVRILPAAHELFDGQVGVADIRPLSEADLLGRREIDTDIQAIAGYLAGRTVLVTGAGGSIGSELCRQVIRFGPSRLVMLDRDESALHSVQMSIDGRALLDSRDLVIADIRDRSRLEEVFAEHQPDVVFHAAALKHLPLLEMHPSEAVKTNVHGTVHLLELSVRSGVERFVNISTDKAANPCSVLGWSKRITERLTAHTSHATDGPFLSVRFGNVLGSRGSVLTAFRAQIEHGGPVTVTDVDVTRFFMTVEEAVQLVIQAGAIGRSGEVLVLDMGEPVRIAEIAQRLVAQANRPIEIVYTGLRPGEKMHEDLLGTDETDVRPFHPLISHVTVPGLSPDFARNLLVDGTAAIVAQVLRDASESGICR